MSRHDSNTQSRGLPAGTPSVESVSHVAANVQEETKPEVLIDFTDSHVVYCFRDLYSLITPQRLAHSEHRQVWPMGLPDHAQSVLTVSGLDVLFVRVSSPGGPSN